MLIFLRPLNFTYNIQSGKFAGKIKANSTKESLPSNAVTPHEHNLFHFVIKMLRRAAEVSCMKKVADKDGRDGLRN